MTDHAVLIPTSEGPVGGIVSEPEGEARAGMILLSGYGRPARSGINSLWTRVARRLAEGGVVVLRVDYSREGETLPIGEGVGGQAAKSDLDLLLLEQALHWFHERLGGIDLFFAGACAGGRIAIELAGANPSMTAGVFAIVPPLQAPHGSERAAGENADRGPGTDADSVDPLLLERIDAIHDRGPIWILRGEHDECEANRLAPLVEPGAAPEVEQVPGMALHFLDQPDLQREIERRLAHRVSRALAEREPIG